MLPCQGRCRGFEPRQLLMKKPVVRLDNWNVTDNPMVAPEWRESRVQGIVHGHPYHEDGKLVTVSRAIAIDPVVRMVVTGQTIYLLGMIDAGYAAEYEDAESRFWSDWSSKLPGPNDD